MDSKRFDEIQFLALGLFPSMENESIDHDWMHSASAIDRTGRANARKHSYGPSFQYGTNINGSFYNHNDLWLSGRLIFHSSSGINEASKSRTALQPIQRTAQTVWRMERLPRDEQHTNKRSFLSYRIRKFSPTSVPVDFRGCWCEGIDFLWATK